MCCVVLRRKRADTCDEERGRLTAAGTHQIARTPPMGLPIKSVAVIRRCDSIAPALPVALHGAREVPLPNQHLRQTLSRPAKVGWYTGLELAGGQNEGRTMRAVIVGVGTMPAYHVAPPDSTCGVWCVCRTGAYSGPSGLSQ